MAKPPETRRPTTRRRRARPERKEPERRRSNAGRVIGAAIGIATAVGVGTGLSTPVTETGPTCGGTERWNVKSANDADASKIDANPQGPFTVAQMNQALPGPLSPGGRMAAEKKQYTVRGFLSFFKEEDDGDYHVVITDQPGDFAKGLHTPPNGRSMVVEFPDVKCLSGKSGLGPSSSTLGQRMAEARLEFEDHTSGISGSKITKQIPVTVTGVGFFDRAHGQKGRTTERAEPDGRGVVFELHPVTEITFDAEAEPD